MSKYVHLISTQSPIEMDQILFSLKHNGIEGRAVGSNALSAGNAELSGINGGSIEVEESQLENANDVLKKIGLGSIENKGDQKILKYGLMAIALIFGYFIMRAILASM